MKYGIWKVYFQIPVGLIDGAFVDMNIGSKIPKRVKAPLAFSLPVGLEMHIQGLHSTLVI